MHTNNMHFHLDMQATGRGNTASCGRISREGGGHTPGYLVHCVICTTVVSGMIVYYKAIQC